MTRTKVERFLLLLLLTISIAPFIVFIDYPSVKDLVVGDKIAIARWILLISSVSGYIGTIILLWEIYLGSRVVTGKFFIDLPWINHIHKLLGKYGTLLIYIHPIAVMFAYAENIFFMVFPDVSSTFEKNITYGRVALYGVLIIWLSSVYLRNKIKYRPWLYIHYISYALIPFVFLHAPQIGTYYKRYEWISRLWYFYIIVTIIFIIIRLLTRAGFGKQSYKMIKKEHFGDYTFLYTLKPLKKALVPKVGQYFYIQIARFKEAHPFTVLHFDKETKELIFGVKTFGKFTNTLENIPVGKTLLLDGPYGAYTLQGQNTEPKVIFAGGIGATPFHDLVRYFPSKEMIFFNCDRVIADCIYRDWLDKNLGKKHVLVISHEKFDKEGIEHGFITQEIVEKYLKKDLIPVYNYFVCGPPPFIQSVEKILKDIGASKKHIFIEKFG